MKHKSNELNVRAKLDIAVARLDADSYIENKQSEVNQLRWLIQGIEIERQNEQLHGSKSNNNGWGTNV